MHKPEIQYRPMKTSDREALENIIRVTWEYDTFCTPKIAKKISRVFLSSCLINQTYTCVALRDNVPVGVIMAKKEAGFRLPLRHFPRLLGKTISLLSSKEGYRVAKRFSVIQRLDQELLAETEADFGGELAFFALRQDQRGAGIGKELFRQAQNYLVSQGVADFFLYTDTSCNYGFYEHLGMTRQGEKIYSLQPYRKADIHFFLYHAHLESSPQA